MSNPTGPRERRMFATHCLSALGCMAQNLQDCIVYEGDGNFQTKRHRHLYVDGQLDRDIGYGLHGRQLFGEMPDWIHGFESVEYCCLLLAVSQEDPGDNRVLRDLLLEPAGADRIFRCVGHIFFRGRCALKMQFRLRPGEMDEDSAWERLWERVAPYWGEAEVDIEVGRAPTAPVHVDIQALGPDGRYEFDGDVVDDAGFEELESEVVTQI
ncbi:4ebda28e-2595-4f68-8c1d-c13f82437418 [Thermothielavioides terrestris]|uniref:4ebda28e-2595-4f68-8c1d-c13f82437418 n=1 Tax=Thermothielavioides terrestris TaxID=2587410 RepID=A0A3S4BHL1_9PEZI|nr:4ebda28e-2595-4f68-8c1d-c13f82437418 [Thermothielavioides terrestris]